MNLKTTDKISNDRPPVFEFAEFSFDAEKKLLWRDGETVSLAPKACELLAVLIENAPQVVSKEDLMNSVWADAFVEEANLTHHISALRKVLGEDKNGRKFIETIPRKGYRFVADIRKPLLESAEVIFAEKTVVQLTEETTIETENLPAVTDRHQEVAAPAAGRRANLTAGHHRPVLIFAGAMIALFAGAAVFGWRYFGSANRPAPASPAEISFKRLTPDADASAPSISPDGASVVYVKNENGQQSLWRKTIASGETTQLTPAVSMMEAGFGATRYSPDGRWIYYLRGYAVDTEITRSIYRIPAGGGEEQKILSGFESDFSISPDGQKIAYVFDWRQLIVFDIETGSKRTVAERDGTKQMIVETGASVGWSPDGTRLIFSASIIDGRYLARLIEVDLVTGAEKQLPVKDDFSINQIEWPADDSGLIVTHKGQIWRVDDRTGATRRLSNETDNFTRLRLSADSKTLVAEQQLGQFNIWTAPAGQIEKRRQITIGAAARHGTQGLALMPDGRIVYSSDESGTTDLWVINETGGERRRLMADAYYPQPTADGRYIVFNSTRSGANQVWRMDADGGNPRQLSRGVESFVSSLSPENEVYYTAFLADEKKYQTYKVSVEGGEPDRVDDFYTTIAPKFSPDGKWILFFGGRSKDENPRIGIIERATGKIVRYLDNAFDVRGWLPDSKSIVDTMARGQQLWRQPIDGGAPAKIYDLSPLRIAEWGFSADGKRVVFSLGNSTSEIVAVSNFSEVSK